MGNNHQTTAFEIHEPVTLAAPEPPDLDKELEKYKALINASAIGAWEYFSETDFLWCNDIYFSMLGRDIKDYGQPGDANLSASWTDLLHPDDKKAATARFDAYLKKPEGQYENYFRMKHLDGSWRWIWSRANLFRDVNKSEHPIIIGTHMDITAHKKAEEAIQQERILLRTLIDSLPDVIYVKDTKGRKIIANSADVKSIGLTTEAEAIGKTDLDLFKNDIGQRGYEDDMRIVQTGEAIVNREEYFLDGDAKKTLAAYHKNPGT